MIALIIFCKASISSQVNPKEPKLNKQALLKTWKKTVVPEFEKVAKAYPKAGLSICLIQDGKVSDMRTKGYRDKARKLPNTPETIVNWGSITKTFTAIAIMQLRDRGKLKLGDPVVKYIPEVRWIRTDSIGVDVEEITIKHLLTHTSGITLTDRKWHYYDDFNDLAHRPIKWEQISAILPYIKVKRRPGVKHVYSNFAFVLLGRVIENIEREAYTAYIYKNILMPLEMNTAHFGTSPPHLKYRKSLSYHKKDKDSTHVVFNMDIHNYGVGNPTGGLCASIEDMTKYTKFLAGTTNRKLQLKYDLVLKPSTLDEMFTCKHQILSRKDFKYCIGLGMFLYEYKKKPLNTHSGAQYGFISYLYFSREQKAGAFIIFNTRDEDITIKEARLGETTISMRHFLGWVPKKKK